MNILLEWERSREPIHDGFCGMVYCKIVFPTKVKDESVIWYGMIRLKKLLRVAQLFHNAIISYVYFDKRWHYAHFDKFCPICWHIRFTTHYIDVIMTIMASQITSLTVVYSIVYSGAGQRKHRSSVSLAFVRGIHRDWWIPRTKGQ